jgi:Alpha/beta hydrolase domain
LVSKPSVRISDGALGLPVLLAVGVIAIFAVAGCSDDDSGRGSSPSGPAADLSEEILAPGVPFIGAASPPRLDEFGFVEREFVAAGTAVSYAPAAPLSGDGRWSFETNGSAPYRTRVVVRYPRRAADFSGTVVFEWLNVSGGIDANPDYASLEEELGRQGHAWVGVSAQLIGIEGGPVLVSAPGAAGLAGKGLKAIDPVRYASLAHPGDGFSFDIYTQVARALRRERSILGGLQPRRLLAAGESQSAIALVSYYNGVQPLTRIFDGFFIHSRAFVGLPLVGPGEYADLARGFATSPVLLRDDLDVPIMNLQAEGDVASILNSAIVRQPDTDVFRLWEVAGTAHADAHLLGPIAPLIDCGAPINDGPLHLVAKAALRWLDQWVREGEQPPKAPRLETTTGSMPQIRRDGDGIALGGLRTPPVDVPNRVLSGAPGPNPELICILLGSTRPLAEGRFGALYPTQQDYVQRYGVSTDSTIDAGYVLPEDRDALLAFGGL